MILAPTAVFRLYLSLNLSQICLVGLYLKPNSTATFWYQILLLKTTLSSWEWVLKIYLCFCKPVFGALARCVLAVFAQLCLFLPAAHVVGRNDPKLTFEVTMGKPQLTQVQKAIASGSLPQVGGWSPEALDGKNSNLLPVQTVRLYA